MGNYARAHRQMGSWCMMDHIPFALGCKHISFPNIMGFCGAPENYMLSFHISRPNTGRTAYKKNNLAQLQRSKEPTVINLPRSEKDPIAFISNKKLPQKTSNQTYQNSNDADADKTTNSWPTQHEICQSGCKVRTPQKSIAADSSVASRRYRVG